VPEILIIIRFLSSFLILSTSNLQISYCNQRWSKFQLTFCSQWMKKTGKIACEPIQLNWTHFSLLTLNFRHFQLWLQKSFFLCISGHWSFIKIWNLAQNYSDCKKETLKKKCVKNESQHRILAKINICINVFFFNPPHFQLYTFMISAIFSKSSWNISFRNIKMSKYRWTFPFD
jgi:hypothetical protein